MSQTMGRIVEIFVFDHTYDTILVCSMVHEGFYDDNNEISINATAFAANEPKIRGNSRNFPNCNTDKCNVVPNEGNR